MTATKTPTVIDPEKTGGLLVDYLTGDNQKVLIIFFHGVGDVVMFAGILDHLKACAPWVEFSVGLLKGLDEKAILPDALEIEPDYMKDPQLQEFDLVFLSHFPLEDANDPTKTKSEIACIREYGIAPISGHKRIEAPGLIGVHFQCTSVPGVANIKEETAKLIWEEIHESGLHPIETHFQHGFHNPVNERYGFIDNHSRGNSARLRNLISLLGACRYFIGGVSGNFHLALSVLGPERVLFLKNRIPVGCFTKEPVQEIDTLNYVPGTVKEWLSKNQSARS